MTQVMTRKVFFSFHYQRDVWRVAKVRNSNVVQNYDKNPFYDKAEWETLKRTGPTAVKSWINRQLQGTSVTVVLIGAETASRPWVKYEIQRSIEMGKAIIGIDISKIKDRHGQTDPTGKNPLPAGYPKYLWNHNNGAENLAKWIEAAIRDQSGR
jgi:hypothetical protein